LHGQATGGDPILLGPVFEIAAGPLQYVEISAKSNAAASAELFWTETLEGPYGGFSQQKYRSFHTSGDGEFRVYRIWPFWHAAKKIVRLRFDPPNAGQFDIQWIRIAEQSAVPPTAAKAWCRDEIGSQWQASGDVEADSSGPILLSPRVAIRAADHPFVCVRMAPTAPAAAACSASPARISAGTASRSRSAPTADCIPITSSPAG